MWEERKSLQKKQMIHLVLAYTCEECLIKVRTSGSESREESNFAKDTIRFKYNLVC